MIYSTISSIIRWFSLLAGESLIERASGVAIDEGLCSALLSKPRTFRVTFGDGPMGLELDQSAAGLEIVAVEGAARRAGIRPMDVIVELNGAQPLVW